MYIFNTDAAVLFSCVGLFQRKPLFVSSNRELRCFANCPTRIARKEGGTYRDLWQQLPKRSGIHTGTSETCKVLILLIAVGLRGYRNVLEFEAFSKCLHLYFRSAGTLIELRCAWKPDGL